MFHFPAFASHTYGFSMRSFGNPGINARLTAPPGFSQPSTPFIAFRRQDIPRTPLVTWPRGFTPLCRTIASGDQPASKCTPTLRRPEPPCLSTGNLTRTFHVSANPVASHTSVPRQRCHSERSDCQRSRDLAVARDHSGPGVGNRSCQHPEPTRTHHPSNPTTQPVLYSPVASRVARERRGESYWRPPDRQLDGESFFRPGCRPARRFLPRGRKILLGVPAVVNAPEGSFFSTPCRCLCRLETTGIEPATSGLQSRRSPN
jgi:hypothetical protein